MTVKIRMMLIVLMLICTVLNLQAEEVNITIPANTPANSAAVSPQPAVISMQKIIFANGAVQVVTDGKPASFSSLRLAKPARLVIDLPAVTNQSGQLLYPSDKPPVTAVTVVPYADKLRLIIEAADSQVFPEAQIDTTATGLVIKLSELNKPVSTPNSMAYIPPDNKPKVAVAKSVASGAVTLHGERALVERIDFQVVDGISRVSVKVQGNVDVNQPVKTPGFVTLTIKNASLPKYLLRSLETSSFNSPVLRVTPLISKKRHETDAIIRVVMRTATPFDFNHEGDMLYLDFKNPDAAPDGALMIDNAAAPLNKRADVKANEEPLVDKKSVHSSVTGQHYSGRKVTLEFADAEIRKIFQLLSEVSNKNFVLGDDVTGSISLKLVNVAWDQALDIILDTKGLDKREENNIITVKKKEQFRSQESADAENKLKIERGLVLEPAKVFRVNYASVEVVAAQMEKLSSGEKGAKIRSDSSVVSDMRSNKIIVIDTLERISRMQSLLSEIDVPEQQVMIEARIVEATTTFTRNLGVNWGMHFRDGNASVLGINQLNTSFGGLANAAPTSGASGQPGAAMGISFGKLASNISLDLRLNAAASAGIIKIISSPKVATLNHKTAKISQGVQIPYQNTTATTGAVTAFVAATLSLEVTPHINANGTIVMKIDAKNDAPGTGSPPPINTKQATTELLLKDGETTVIGGIFVDSETDSDDGVPYLMDIPFFGKLFMSSSKTKNKNELLIFITPRILGGI